MIYKQKKWGEQSTFDFQPETLVYSFKKGIQTEQFTVPYEQINLSNSVEHQGHMSMRNMFFVLLFCMGGFMRGINIASHGVIAMICVMLIFCAAGLCFYFYIKSENQGYTKLDGTKCNIFLFHDKQYDTIFTQLKASVKNRLRALHGEVNFSNSYESELDKFNYLKTEQIISPDEYDDAFAKIKERIRHRNLEINADTPPETEILKFEWMLTHRFISEDEFRRAVAKIKLLSGVDYEPNLIVPERQTLQ